MEPPMGYLNPRKNQNSNDISLLKRYNIITSCCVYANPLQLVRLLLSGLFRRHFVHRENLLSWSMAVEHSLQRDGRPISLEEDGIIHRKGKQWTERENWAVSRTPIESLSTSDLWLVTRIIHPVIVSTALPALFRPKNSWKTHQLRLVIPPLLWENILVASLVIFRENKEKARGAPSSALMQSKYRPSR